MRDVNNGCEDVPAFTALRRDLAERLCKPSLCRTGGQTASGTSRRLLRLVLLYRRTIPIACPVRQSTLRSSSGWMPYRPISNSKSPIPGTERTSLADAPSRGSMIGDRQVADPSGLFQSPAPEDTRKTTGVSAAILSGPLPKVDSREPLQQLRAQAITRRPMRTGRTTPVPPIKLFSAITANSNARILNQEGDRALRDPAPAYFTSVMIRDSTPRLVYIRTVYRPLDNPDASN